MIEPPSLVFTVPGVPLSVNKLYRRGGSEYWLYGHRDRFLTSEGKAYKQKVTFLATLALKKHGLLPAGHCAVVIQFFFPTTANDIDGPLKPMLDAMQDAGVFANDNRVVRLLAIKRKDPKNPRAEVVVTAVSSEIATA